MKKIISVAVALCVIISMFASYTASGAGVERTLLEYNYSGGVAEAEMDEALGNKTDGYIPSDQIDGVDARLFPSVNGTDARKLEWSKDEYDVFDEGGNNVGKQLVPVMTGGSKNPWGEAPYIILKFSAAGYSDLRFSAGIGGSKKGPRDFKLQYSLDGASYTDLSGASCLIGKNKEVRVRLSAALGSVCDNAETVYVKIATTSNICISGVDYFPESTGGETAINNIKVTGKSVNPDEFIAAPTFSCGNEYDGYICADDFVTISDVNGPDSVIYYSINDGEPAVYSGPVQIFGGGSSAAKSVKLTAWSTIGDRESQSTEKEYNLLGASAARYNYSEQPANSSGEVTAASGIYSAISAASATLNGSDIYVPLYDNGKEAMAISPDDGLKWQEGTAWIFKTSTAGLKDCSVAFYTGASAKAPSQFVLEYSLDGSAYTEIETINLVNSASGLTGYRFALPTSASGKAEVYIRMRVSANKTMDGGVLFNNESKGNWYFNNFTVAGFDHGDPLAYLDLPSYYTPGEAIACISQGEVRVVAVDSDGATAFDDSLNNGETFTLNGESDYYDFTVTNSDGAVFARRIPVAELLIASISYPGNSVGSDGSVTDSQSGAVLSMYPNGVDAAGILYGENCFEVDADAANSWVAGSAANVVQGAGYWLITLDTTGYGGIVFSADMASSNKGPRDFALAYSLDGSSYTFIKQSQIRTGGSLETGYDGFALPAAVDNRSAVYIKIFIAGRENRQADELADVTASGTTRISNIKFSGRAFDVESVIPGDVDDNGSVSVSDVVALRQLIMGGELTDRQLRAGDLVTDGTLNVSDVVVLRQLIMNG